MVSISPYHLWSGEIASGLFEAFSGVPLAKY